MENLVSELIDGEFYLPWDNSAVMENELASLVAINSGIVVISGTVGTGRTHLLQAFASRKVEQGLNVLLIAHEHNEIQGIDTLIFHKADRMRNRLIGDSIDTMLSRIDAINPDVIVFDDMNYAEILKMANVLAEKGKLVIASCYYSPYRGDTLTSRFELINEEKFIDLQEELIAGHVNVKNSLIRKPANTKTRVIAKVLKS